MRHVGSPRGWKCNSPICSLDFTCMSLFYFVSSRWRKINKGMLQTCTKHWEFFENQHWFPPRQVWGGWVSEARTPPPRNNIQQGWQTPNDPSLTLLTTTRRHPILPATSEEKSCCAAKVVRFIYVAHKSASGKFIHTSFSHTWLGQELQSGPSMLLEHARTEGYESQFKGSCRCTCILTLVDFSWLPFTDVPLVGRHTS